LGLFIFLVFLRLSRGWFEPERPPEGGVGADAPWKWF
jgi:hypothetical protein